VKNMSTALFSLSLVLLMSLASSQVCLQLYENRNLAGRKTTVCQNGDLPAGWNDRVSSISVPRGYSAVLYSDFGYGGESREIGPGRWNADGGFNDVLSSLVILKQGSGPVFFADYDLQGTSFTKNSDGNVLPSWNDRVSSIYVPSGMIVILYSDYGYGGEATYLFSGVWNAPDEWNDQLSSVRVAQECILLFEDYNFQGDYFSMCSSDDVPAEWNDRVSSIVVPEDWSVTLFQDYGFSGNSMDIEAGEWEADDDWNDQLSSLVVDMP